MVWLAFHQWFLTILAFVIGLSGAYWAWGRKAKELPDALSNAAAMRDERVELLRRIELLAERNMQLKAIETEHKNAADDRASLLAKAEELERLKSERADLIAERARLKDDIATYERVRTEHAALAAERPALLEKVEERDGLTSERAEWLAERSRLLARIESLEPLRDQSAQWAVERGVLLERVEELEGMRAERAAWREERARMQRLPEEVEMLRAEKDALLAANGRLERGHAELTAAVERYAQDHEELDVLRAEAAKWNAERSGLNVRIAELEGRLSPAVWVTRARSDATRLSYTVADQLRRKSDADGAPPESDRLEAAPTATPEE